MNSTRHTSDGTISFIGSAYPKTMDPIKIFIKTWRSQRSLFGFFKNELIITFSFLKSGKASDWCNNKRKKQTNCAIAINLSERNEYSKSNASNQKHPKIILIHLFRCCLSSLEKGFRLIGRFFHFKNKEKRIHEQNPRGKGNQCDKGVFDNQEGKQQKHKPHQSANGFQRMKGLAIFKGLDKPRWNPSTIHFCICIFRHLTSLETLINSSFILTFTKPITK